MCTDSALSITPAVFGSLSGNVIFLDRLSSSKSMRKLKLFDGPVLSLAKSDWGLVALGTNQTCSLDRVVNAYSGYHQDVPQLSDLQLKLQLQIASKGLGVIRPAGTGKQHYQQRYHRAPAGLNTDVKRLVATEKWPTLIGVLDFRTMRLLEMVSTTDVALNRDVLKLEKTKSKSNIGDFWEGEMTRLAAHPTWSKQSELIPTSVTKVDYTEAVSILDPPLDPTPQPVSPANDDKSLVATFQSSSLLNQQSTQSLQLLNVQSHYQLAQHILGMNADGRILSIGVRKSQ